MLEREEDEEEESSLTWKKWIDSGTWEVGVAGVKYAAEVSLRPMYDPKNEKIKA